MKKLLIFVIILAALAIVMKIMVPSREQHYNVATEKLTELLKDKASEEFAGADKVIENHEETTKKAVKMTLENYLEINDYFVCNVGYVTYDGKKYPLTIGLFNHVFVTTDYIDDIKAVSEKIENLK